MYDISEGRIAIIDDFGGPQQRTLAEYGPGGVVGEYTLLTGQAAYLSAVAVEPTRLIEIKPGELRELMAQEETLNELILRALLRRIAVMISLHTGLSIIGSSYSADARRHAQQPVRLISPCRAAPHRRHVTWSRRQDRRAATG
jgi:thioredoxin reductase (NADPH)